MANTKENRRVRYTKMVIKEAFLSLLQTKPINKITVSEICEIADVNRGTFYSYYLDVYDLLHKVEDELYNSISESIESAAIIRTTADLLNRIFQTIAENGDLCKALFGAYGDKDFLTKCCSIQRERIISEWRTMLPNVSEEKLHYIHSYVANGSVGIIERWIKHGFRESPAELA